MRELGFGDALLFASFVVVVVSVDRKAYYCSGVGIGPIICKLCVGWNGNQPRSLMMNFSFFYVADLLP